MSLTLRLTNKRRRRFRIRTLNWVIVALDASEFANHMSWLAMGKPVRHVKPSRADSGPEAR